ncbi:MAG: Uma2 family endonuclease [Gemmataceae bacterium]|nr:Uma2 family endonuclease [Gemmataceae bacterium]
MRGPDVGYWSRARLPIPPTDGYPEISPDLAVEVMSPHDVFRELYQKVREYLRAGTKQVWVFLSEDRSGGVFYPDGSEKLLNENETLDGGDVLPGFSCRVGDFFPA